MNEFKKNNRVCLSKPRKCPRLNLNGFADPDILKATNLHWHSTNTGYARHKLQVLQVSKGSLRCQAHGKSTGRYRGRNATQEVTKHSVWTFLAHTTQPGSLYPAAPSPQQFSSVDPRSESDIGSNDSFFFFLPFFSCSFCVFFSFTNIHHSLSLMFVCLFVCSFTHS